MSTDSASGQAVVPAGSASTELRARQKIADSRESEHEWGHMVVRWLRKKRWQQEGQCTVKELLTAFVMIAKQRNEEFERDDLRSIVDVNTSHLKMWQPTDVGPEMIECTKSKRDKVWAERRH